jgi:hypothetical protein
MSGLPSLRTKPTRFFDRYELLDESPHVTGGRLFRARDLAFAETVGVKQLGADRSFSVECRLQLEKAVRQLQRLDSRHLVRFYAFHAASGILVQEWIPGISLLDLLRRRRELAIYDVLRLLESLPGILDFIARDGMTVPRPLLGNVIIEFPGHFDAESILKAPMEQWPSFTLKLNTLNIRRMAAAPSSDDTTRTAIGATIRGNETADPDGPHELARLIYELLGGPIRELDARRYSPVPALREAGNAVLRRALFTDPQPSCEALWRDLLATRPEFCVVPIKYTISLPVPRVFRIPDPFVGVAKPGQVLTLNPLDRSSCPIRLVARPRFNIGRSAQQADFVSRLMPENETNNVLTNRLSRIHTFLELEDGGMRARDGSGSGPSLNGSFLDGERLSPEIASPLTHRSLLRLGREYSMELVPVYAHAPREVAISNLEAWRGLGQKLPEGGPAGALVCLPADGHPPVRESVWLFSQAGFGLNASEHLVWDTRGHSVSPAAFHFLRGCFWLSNHSLPETALACENVPLLRDEIVPLAPGQVVRLGAHTFTAEFA